MVYFINNKIIFNPEDNSLSLINSPESRVAISNPARRVLQLLIDQLGTVVLRETFFKKVWDDYGLSASNNNLNHCVSKLRKVMVTLGYQDEFIVTVPRVGFIIHKGTIIICQQQPVAQNNSDEFSSAISTTTSTNTALFGSEDRAAAATPAPPAAERTAMDDHAPPLRASAAVTPVAKGEGDAIRPPQAKRQPAKEHVATPDVADHHVCNSTVVGEKPADNPAGQGFTPADQTAGISVMPGDNMRKRLTQSVPYRPKASGMDTYRIYYLINILIFALLLVWNMSLWAGKDDLKAVLRVATLNGCTLYSTAPLRPGYRGEFIERAADFIKHKKIVCHPGNVLLFQSEKMTSMINTGSAREFMAQCNIDTHQKITLCLSYYYNDRTINVQP
ncbi:winged helix-turn-helix domain-containing protein [Erwinia tasmaniensis]|uniref:winged helix-turn-helix domain-containing protein n=1 Tax=Erwinia tasmaniensis TaxID=338565 RepID=UPI003A4E3699